jgi:hypothetical protein
LYEEKPLAQSPFKPAGAALCGKRHPLRTRPSMSALLMQPAWLTSSAANREATNAIFINSCFGFGAAKLGLWLLYDKALLA